MGRRFLLLFILGAAVAGNVHASPTRLYLKVSASTPALSLTPPSEVSSDAVSGGASGCTAGCSYVPGLGDLDCGGIVFVTDPSILSDSDFASFRFVTTETWGKDPGASESNPTGFVYHAGCAGGGVGWAQPTIRIRYIFNDPGAGYPVVTDVQGPPYACTLSSFGSMDTFNKYVGGNIPTVSSAVLGPSPLPASLPAGSTVIVDVWNADGTLPGVVYSYQAKESYIDIPYSKDNFTIRGAVAPQYLLPNLSQNMTFLLDNTAPTSPLLTKVEIAIPGRLAGTTLFVSSVSVIGVSRTIAGSTVVQATTAAAGAISIDFGSNAVAAGSSVYITFSTNSATTTLNTGSDQALLGFKWDAVAYAGTSPYILAETAADAMYTVVMRPPPPPFGLTIQPWNIDSGGQQLRLSWNGPASPQKYGQTAYMVFRPTYSAIAVVPPLGGSSQGPSSWKPSTSLVTLTAGLNWTATGLVNGSCYCYSVATVNPVGMSAISSTYLICGTPYAGPGRPASVTLLVASGQAQLAWSPVADATYAVAGYEVWRATCAGCTLSSYQALAATASVFNEGSLSNSARYTYEVRAYDAEGHRGAFSVTESGRPAVNPPGALTPRFDYAASGVTLRWATSAGNVYPLAGYYVYKSTCSSCAMVKDPTILPVTATVYLDTAVVVASMYYYAVSTVSTEGGATEGPASDSIKILVPPAAPSTLTVMPWAGAAFYVEWSIAPNLPGTVNGYRIYRATYAGVPQTGYVNWTTAQTSTAALDSFLTDGKRYYYAVSAYLVRGEYAESSLGGEASAVVEPSAPPGLTYLPGDTVVHISWTDLRPAQEVDRYNVWRSTESPSLDFELVFSGTSYAYDDGGVTNGILYYYRVSAENAAGEGPRASVTTGVVPFRPPGTPGSFAAFSSVSRVNLLWESAAETTFPIANYEIWRTTKGGTPYALRASPGASATFYPDSIAITNGTTYFYQIRAVDSAGHPGLFAAEVGVTPAFPPCAPASLAGTATPTQVEIRWPMVSGTLCAPSSSLPVSGYRVYRSSFSGGGRQPLAWSVGADATTYVDATVATGIVYYYTVRTYDTAIPPNETVSTSSPFPPVFSAEYLGAPRVPASPPQSLTVLAGSPVEHDAAVKLSWVPAVPGSFDVIGYDVFRSTTVGGPETRFYVSGGDSITYLDTTPSNLRFYYYRVASIEENGFTGGWEAVTATPYRDPLPPTGLTLSEGQMAIYLKWTAPAATSYPVTAYRVVRATFSGIAGSAPVGPVPLWATTFTDTGVVDGTGYWYHVQTFDVAGHLSYGYSNEASGTPFTPPQAPLWLTARSVQAGASLSWYPSVGGTLPVSAYQVLRGLTAGVSACSTCTIGTVWDSAATTYGDTGLVNGTMYWYAVRVLDDAGHWGTAGAAASVVPAIPPCAPSSVSAVATAAQVALSWGTVYGASCSPGTTFAVSGYAVYRGTYPGYAGAALTVRIGATASVYIDGGVVAGETYYYRVRTLDKGTPNNEGLAFSPEAEATPLVRACAPAGLTIVHGPFEHDTMLKLAWSASSPGSLSVAGYNVYRSTCATCPQAKVAGPGSAGTLSYLDTVLTNRKYYYYRVMAVDSKGFEGNWGAVAGTPYADPNAPGGLTIRESDGVLTVGWDVPAATDYPVASYRVSRATWSGITGLEVLLPDPFTATTFTDTTVTNGTAYFYHVQTRDNAGHLSWDYSVEVSGTPYALPGAPPNPGALPGDMKVTLSWDAATPGTWPVSGYAIYRALVPGVACGGVPYTTVCCGALELIDTGLVNAQPYYYKVAAFDSVSGGHLSSCTAEVTATPAPTLQAPGKPSNLTPAASPGAVVLGWQAGTAATRPISGYSIYRTTYAGNSALVQEEAAATALGGAGTGYLDLGVTNAIVYYYRVRTRDDNAAFPSSATAYLSEPSNQVAAFPAAAPLGCTAVAGTSQVFIQWQWTQAGAGGLGVSGYRVYRATGATGPYGLVHTTMAYAYATSWTDSSTPPGQSFWYGAAARHALGWMGPMSATASATPGGPPSVPVLSATAGEGKVVLAWGSCTSPFPPVTTYVVYRGTFSGFQTGIALGKSGPAASPPLTYTDTGAGVLNGVPYYYRVWDVDSSPTSASTYSNEAYALPLGIARGVSATPGDGLVALGWTAPSDPGGVSGYIVYRRTLTLAEGVAGTVFGVSPGPWTDAAVANGVMYYYRVRVFDRITPPVILGGFSAEVRARPSTPPGAPPILSIAPLGQRVDLAWGPAAPAGTFPTSGYRVYRSSAGGPYALRATVLSGSVFADFPLTNGVAWYYQVSAFDTLVPPSEGPRSNPVWAVPYANPTAPGTPTIYAASGSLLVGWSTAFVQSTFPVAGWNVYRGTASKALSAFPVNGVVPVAATYYLDSGLVNGTRYWYAVRTVDSQGNMSASTSENSAAPFVPPGAPVLSVTTGDRRAKLDWNATTGTFAPVTTYAIYRGTFAGFSPGTAITKLTGASPPVTYTDLTLTNGRAYYYRVGAIDSGGIWGPHETRSAEQLVVVLGVPLSLSAIPGDTRISLAWTPSAGGVAGIAGYGVYRRTLFSAEAQVGTAPGSTATSYSDAAPPLSNGTRYYYRVAPVDSLVAPVNTGGFSPEAQATPGNGPSAPTIVAMTPAFQRVDFNWTPPSALGSNPLGGYRVYRSSNGGAYSIRASVAATVTFYADTGLVNGNTLAYRVGAYDTFGIEGPLSNAQSGIPYAPPNAPARLTVQLRNGAIYLNWATVYLSGSATVFVQTTFPPSGYLIYRSVVSNPPALPAPMFTAATYYVDSGLVNGTRYYYKVATVDTGGHPSTTSFQAFGAPYAPVGAPVGVTALPGNNLVMLAWNPGSGGTYLPVSGYYVYRGAAPGAETLLAGPVFATLYGDSTALNGVPYWYTVRARDSRGNPGNESVEVTETPAASFVNPPMKVTLSMVIGGIRVSWGMTVTGASPGGPTSQYAVLRATCAACAYDTISPSASAYVSSTVFSWNDTAIVAGKYYRYAVLSVAAGPPYAESLVYPWVQAVVPSACGPPYPPASIVVLPGSGAVSLKWTPPSTISPCHLPLMYRVYRSSDGEATWLTLTTTGDLAMVDTTVVNGTTYVYRVNTISAMGNEDAYGTKGPPVTPTRRATSAYLAHNAFAPLRGESMDLTYTMSEAGPVTVRIFTITGMKVWEAKIDRQEAGPSIGYYSFGVPGSFTGWDGKASDGKLVASGVYLIEFEAGTFRRQMKVIVIK